MNSSSWCCIFCGENNDTLQKHTWWWWIFGSSSVQWQTHGMSPDGRTTTKCMCCLPGVIRYQKEKGDFHTETVWKYPLCCAKYTETEYPSLLTNIDKRINIHMESPCLSYSQDIYIRTGAAKEPTPTVTQVAPEEVVTA